VPIRVPISAAGGVRDTGGATACRLFICLKPHSPPSILQQKRVSKCLGVVDESQKVSERNRGCDPVSENPFAHQCLPVHTIRPKEPPSRSLLISETLRGTKLVDKLFLRNAIGLRPAIFSEDTAPFSHHDLSCSTFKYVAIFAIELGELAWNLVDDLLWGLCFVLVCEGLWNRRISKCLRRSKDSKRL